MLGHQLGEADEHPAALGRVCERPVPAIKGPARRRDGAVDVFGTTTCHAGDLGPVAR